MNRDSACRSWPTPESVELLWFVELQADHHAVGHSLGTHIIAAHIIDEGHRVVHLVINRALVGLSKTREVAWGEEVLPERIHTCIDLFLADAKNMFEVVGVLACIECALGWKCIYRDRLVVARIRHHIA